jgi:NADH:ubiquinone oxidoreductase subunit 2 (subunit N)
MYMYDPETGAPMVLRTRLLSTALGISAVATIVLGVLPNSLYEWALQAAAPLLP